ncbi:hypothetical protein KQ939_01550 [Planococcus sp. CP5-4]|uniref:hypothetical protein n=1 Tax=unclassified Planococcus (in: firmicutes) TaxID=2662419 RepID=UPI001C2332BF|nr:MULTISPECIES: hypothetical protein [unclassified Planococcus (in: firmicutes)]MBU9673081.1 hypothetical protein [Planococcus sp. CP5-4_YE]MBV0908327.1 hypothetical protein [Planococcus sp. CP5-4_UN]MBW6062389.1 hypothetical protein [Planococcus sp. CP5-4]
MKLAALSIWVVAALTLGFAGATGWPLITGLILLPVFFVGKPWYESFARKTAERK